MSVEIKRAMDSKDCIKLGRQFRRWKYIGKKYRLQEDAEIAKFLINWYLSENPEYEGKFLPGNMAQGLQVGSDKYCELTRGQGRKAEKGMSLRDKDMADDSQLNLAKECITTVELETEQDSEDERYESVDVEYSQDHVPGIKQELSNFLENEAGVKKLYRKEHTSLAHAKELKLKQEQNDSDPLSNNELTAQNYQIGCNLRITEKMITSNTCEKSSLKLCSSLTPDLVIKPSPLLEQSDENVSRLFVKQKTDQLVSKMEDTSSNQIKGTAYPTGLFVNAHMQNHSPVTNSSTTNANATNMPSTLSPAPCLSVATGSQPVAVVLVPVQPQRFMLINAPHQRLLLPKQ